MGSSMMSPKEAADVLYIGSNAGLLTKLGHMQCEQAKAVLDVALKRLQDRAKERKKPKGAK